MNEQENPSKGEKKKAIQSVIKAMMDRVMHKVLVEDPFLPGKHKAEKPLYAALVPKEIFKGSHFERRFVTPFGKAWEKLAIVAATHGLEYGVLGHKITGKVKQERLRRITEILNRLEHAEQGRKRGKPNWQEELNYVLDGKGKDIPVSVICDVYAEDRKKSKSKLAFELKAPLPNSDQTKVSKEKLLNFTVWNLCRLTKHIMHYLITLTVPSGRRMRGLSLLDGSI